MNIKVLQLAASIAPRDGGPSVGAIALNREFVSRNDESLLVTTDADGHRNELDVELGSVQESNSGRVLYCKSSFPRRLKNSWQMARFVLRSAGEFDIVHVHGLYLANSVLGFVASMWHKIPLVIQPHGTLEPYQRGRSIGRKAVFDAVVGKRILKTASAIMAASVAEQENIRAVYPDAKILSIPLGVKRETPCVSPERLDGLRTWLETPQNKRLVFLGRLAPKKRVDILIDAWSAVDEDCSLLIVGPLEDWTTASLLSRAPLERRDRLAVYGQASRAEAAWILEQAGIFALPSENENFGISVIEALLHGCAVVTTAQVGAGRYVLEADAGVVLEHPDVPTLVDALRDLLGEQPDKLLAMGARGRDFATQRLSWTNTADSLLGAYTSLIRKV